MTYCNNNWYSGQVVLSDTKICPRVGGAVRELNCRAFGNVITQLVAKTRSIICVNLSIEAGARDRNIRETEIDEIRMNGTVHVDEHAVGGQPLRTVAGDGVSVIEMRMLCGIELDIPVVFCAERNVPVSIDLLDCA